MYANQSPLAPCLGVVVIHFDLNLRAGVAYFGLNMEIAHNLPDYYDTANNGIIMPIANTLRPLAWSSTPTRRMGHVISSVLAADGSPDTASPRYIAALQVMMRMREMRGRGKGVGVCIPS